VADRAPADAWPSSAASVRRLSSATFALRAHGGVRLMPLPRVEQRRAVAAPLRVTVRVVSRTVVCVAGSVAAVYASWGGLQRPGSRPWRRSPWLA
jgi:hypothetical protein